MMKLVPWLLVAGALAVVRAEEEVNFNRDIRPILSEHCFHCHGPDAKTREAKLRLDTAEGAHAEVIVPGAPEQSELVARILSDDEDEVMPPPETGKPLNAEQVALLQRWIAAGAEYEAHWAFLAPGRPEVPAGAGAIDHFVSRRAAQEGAALNGEADRRVLLRRVSLDLTGLPPTPGEIEAFLADESAGAWERVVDRLLASPRYGEHMARFWLDAVRYGDTHGLHLDNYREIWPYRDWVVRAFNDNKRWDDFLTEQLAGDLLDDPTTDQLVATGFNRAHVTTAEGGSIKEEVYVRNVTDRVATFGTVMLGLSTECASCHDHKFDPLTQREFYSLFAYFNNLDADPMDGNRKDHAPVVRLIDEQGERRLAAAQAVLAEARRELEEAGKEADKKIRETLQAAVKKAEKEVAGIENSYPTSLIWKERKGLKPAHILDRGLYDQRGEEVPRALPEFLPPLPKGAPNDRLGLARWLTAPEHPLAARVAVNRFWQQLFGVGLVKTAEDFGSQGEWPSHPELLDWLAVEFRESGWDVKRLLKTIVMSETYRRSSQASPEAYRRDPENRLLARGPRFRLDAESLRDQALAVSGLLVEKLGGPGVKPPQPDGLWHAVAYTSSNTARFKADTGPEKVHRRSLYTFWKRTAPPPQMIDAPSRESCVVRRERTNTPLQALMFMNDPQFVEAARAFAERFADRPEEEIPGLLYAHALARPPAEDEAALLLQSFRDHLAHYEAHPEAARALVAIGDAPAATDQPARLAAWTMVASLVLNLDEFVTKN